MFAYAMYARKDQRADNWSLRYFPRAFSVLVVIGLLVVVSSSPIVPGASEHDSSHQLSLSVTSSLSGDETVLEGLVSRITKDVMGHLPRSKPDMVPNVPETSFIETMAEEEPEIEGASYEEAPDISLSQLADQLTTNEQAATDHAVTLLQAQMGSIQWKARHDTIKSKYAASQVVLEALRTDKDKEIEKLKTQLAAANEEQENLKAELKVLRDDCPDHLPGSWGGNAADEVSKDGGD